MKEKELVEVGKKVVKQKRPKKSEAMAVQTEPGDNTTYLQNAMIMARLPKINHRDVEQLEERIQLYFDICVEKDIRPSVSGMALAIGVDRRTLWRWSVEESNIQDTIKRAYQILNVMMEEYMQNGKINPVSGIFLMKNNFGYADKQEVIVTPNNPMGELKDNETIKQKYIENVIIDNDEQ